MERESHLHDMLLRIIAPLVMLPFGPRPVDAMRLGGIVRVSRDRTRVILLPGAGAPAGFAIEFCLTGDDGTELDVDAAVDWLRTLTAADLRTVAGESDSHGHMVVDAQDIGFSPGHRADQFDINYFSILRQFLYGGGALWFEKIFSVSGYLVLNAYSHRLYVTKVSTGEVIGIDLPLLQADGTVRPGQGGTFPSILPSLIEDDMEGMPKVAAADDYCSVAYDLSEWI